MMPFQEELIPSAATSYSNNHHLHTHTPTHHTCNKDWQLIANDHIFITLVRVTNESLDEAEGPRWNPAVDISGFLSRNIEMRLRN
jgi:hypothetical protein